jgi:hypothetical protein
MHVLLDSRMIFEMGIILSPRDRHALDEQPVEPWADHVEPLYNDRHFCPEAQPLPLVNSNSVCLGDRRGCDECKELLESEQWFAI